MKFSQDTSLKTGDKVKAVRPGFAIAIGDTATVVEIVGVEENSLSQAFEMRIKVHMDKLGINVETDADMWECVK